MTSPRPGLHNLVEPASLIRHFLAAPPEGFSTLTLAGHVPAFSTRFDLLTTMEPGARSKVEALPFAWRLRRWLHQRACFVGTTVSEYALLPDSISPEVFVRDVLREMSPRAPLLIVKDLPTESVLVGDAAFDYSRRLADACRAKGFVLVEGQALAYVPVDFPSVDAFLARESRSRRKDVRRKLKSVPKLETQVVQTGDAVFEDAGLLSTLYDLYLNVYRQSEIQFDRLSAAFFTALLRDPSCRGLVFLYRAGGELIGYNVCFVENRALVDKYVGFRYPQAREHNLYVVSWFRNLEYALSRGLRFYIAGWTDPEIKCHLGARFTFTRHAVYARNPVLRGALLSFRRLFEADRNWYTARGPAADPRL